MAGPSGSRGRVVRAHAIRLGLHRQAAAGSGRQRQELAIDAAGERHGSEDMDQGLGSRHPIKEKFIHALV